MSTINSDHYYDVWRDYYLAIQGFFYLAQGIAMGAILFFPEFLVALGTTRTDSIIFQAIIWIPWYLKIFFGILSDNYPIKSFGRRKPYIFVAGFLGVIGWATIPMFTSFSPLLLVVGIFASFGTAMSDSTIDALSVDVTPKHRRGAMQGISWGMRALGIGISGVLSGKLVGDGQYFLLFAVPGTLVSLAAFAALLFKENPLPEDFKRIPGSVYKKVFSNRKVKLVMLFQLVSGGGIALIPILESFLKEDLGFLPETIGWFILVFAFANLIGALLFGLLGDKLSVKKILPIATLLYVVFISIILFIDTSHPYEPNTLRMLYIFFGSIGFIDGGYEATQMRLGMDFSARVLAGTSFNLYNSLSNIGQIAVGAVLIAILADSLGFAAAWQICSVFLILAFIIAYFVFDKDIEELQSLEI